jgi:hypothetical protein
MIESNIQTQASVYEDNVMKFIGSCQIVGEHGNREGISNKVIKEVNIIKIQYMHVWNTKLKPP